MRSYGYWVGFLKWLTDLSMTVLAFWLAYYLRFDALTWLFPVRWGYPEISIYWKLFGLVLLAWTVVFYSLRAYRPRHWEGREEEFFHILIGVGVASAVVWGLALYYRVFHQRNAPPEQFLEPSRLMFVMFMFLDVTGIVAGRAFIRWLAERLRARGWQIQRALIVGNGTLGRALASRIWQHPEYGIRIVGMVDGENGDSFHDVPVLGSIEDLPRIVREHGVQALFIALPADAFSKALSIVQQFQTQPISIHMAMDVLTASHLRTTISEIDGLPLLNINDTPLQGAAAVAKRVLDIVLSALALILLAPLMLLIALLIKLTSRGPVIYRQIRMGLDGRPFVMYKFRTMVEDAEEATGPTMAGPTDPRRTPIGKVLRFLSFDELPQFWNVLKGDMSLVGPRPERPYFVADFCQRYSQYMLRHRVKGGITGWAQVNGFRGDRDYERRIEYDLYYLTHWSIGLDLWILLVTPFRMFRYTGI